MNLEKNKGFTLIELLVVIAIIGILSTVVLASLNAARTKGQIASIKSTLKNTIPQAELAYDTPGNYSTVCSTDVKIASMITSINNSGGTANCYTLDNTRWGISAKLNSDSTQNFSVDQSGVVAWDTADKTFSNWDTANTNCAATGGRLPSYEELKAFSLAYSSTTPSGFVAGGYWSGTTMPSNSAGAYSLNISNGSIGFSNKANGNYVRCVH